MKICPNCQHTTDSDLNYCPSCGAMMQAVPEAPAAPEAPAYEAPAPTYAAPATPAYEAPAAPYAQPQQGYVQPPQYTYAQPPYVQPMYAQPQPPRSPVSKGKVITGMALGIAGMAMAILGLLYTTIYFFISFAMAEMALATAIMGFVFMAFSLPLSIVGLKLSSDSRALGDQTKMSALGEKFGRVGLVLSIVMGGIAFISIFIAASAF